jgi:ABC-type branched-subunit amino acid transport system substrate-binding protein
MDYKKLLLELLVITATLASTSVFAGAKIRVGFLGAFSGNDPNTSNELFRGAQIFLKSNKIAGQSLELEKIDTKGQIQGAAIALGEATSKGIKLFIGIANSDEAVAAAKFADEHDVLFITPFATNEKVALGKRNAFQACFNDKQQGKALAGYAKALAKGGQIAILTNEMSSYSTGLSETFITDFDPSSKPIQIMYSTSDLEGKKESIIRELKALKTKLAFIPDHILRASILA